MMHPIIPVPMSDPVVSIQKLILVIGFLPLTYAIACGVNAAGTAAWHKFKAWRTARRQRRMAGRSEPEALSR
jgi:hypothetical protein